KLPRCALPPPSNALGIPPTGRRGRRGPPPSPAGAHRDAALPRPRLRPFLKRRARRRGVRPAAETAHRSPPTWARGEPDSPAPDCRSQSGHIEKMKEVHSLTVLCTGIRRAFLLHRV